MVVTTTQETVQREVLWQRAELVPNSWRDEDQSVEAVLSAGRPGRRFTKTGKAYDEALEISTSAIRWERLNKGCSVLDSHSDFSVRTIVGRVVPDSARIVGGELLARLRLSVAEADKGLVANIRAGIVNAISVGYRVYKEIIDATRSPPLHLATDWEVFEVSFVPINFDASATTRSAMDREKPNECLVIRQHRSEGQMDPLSNPTTTATPPNETRGGAPASGSQPLETRGAGPAPAQPAAPAAPTPELQNRSASVDVDQLRREGATQEATRQREIRSLAGRLRIENAVVQPILDDPSRTLDQARLTFVEHMAVRSDATAPSPMGSPISLVSDERTKVREAATLALMHRGNPSRYPLDKDTTGAREFAGMSLTRMGEELVRRAEPSFRWGGREELVQRMFHTPSDFPFIAQSAVRRTLRDQYEEAPATWKPWVRQTTMQDFRPTTRVQMASMQDLLEVPAGGEIEASELGENAEGYALSTFARKISLDRRTIINDDLQAFSRIPQLMGNAARRIENNKVWAIITANAALADGVALFHATHANLITPALSLVGLTAARVAMRGKKGPNGEFLDVVPRYLIVPTTLETTAWQLMNGEIMATGVTSANPFKGTMTVVVDPRLDANSTTAWYLAAATTSVDTVEIAFLEGSNGPIVEQHEHFDYLGTSFRVYHDVGTKAIDFVGLLKSSGTT